MRNPLKITSTIELLNDEGLIYRNRIGVGVAYAIYKNIDCVLQVLNIRSVGCSANYITDYYIVNGLVVKLNIEYVCRNRVTAINLASQLIRLNSYARTALRILNSQKRIIQSLRNSCCAVIRSCTEQSYSDSSGRSLGNSAAACCFLVKLNCCAGCNRVV